MVYLPPGYPKAGLRYPVLYLQDGQNLFDPATAFGGRHWRAGETADELIGRGAMEPLIMVGVYHTGTRRISEYTPTRDRRLRKGPTVREFWGSPQDHEERSMDLRPRPVRIPAPQETART